MEMNYPKSVAEIPPERKEELERKLVCFFKVFSLSEASLGRKGMVYIIRASFSQERMTYFPEDSKVVYRSKNGKQEKVFDALEWLAALASHVPNKGESFDLEALDRQMVRFYGYCSNVSNNYLYVDPVYSDGHPV